MIQKISFLFIPLILLFSIGYSIVKKNNAYDSFLKGVKETLPLFLDIFPSLLAMFLCVSLLKACGIIEDIKSFALVFFPKGEEIIDLTPMILFRPISGSASISCFDSLIKEFGPDSFIVKMASSIQGSTDTTVYVLALYFSYVNIKKWKHALKCGLMTDLVGIIVGIILSYIFFK